MPIDSTAVENGQPMPEEQALPDCPSFKHRTSGRILNVQLVFLLKFFELPGSAHVSAFGAALRRREGLLRRFSVGVVQVVLIGDVEMTSFWARGPARPGLLLMANLFIGQDIAVVLGCVEMSVVCF